MFNLMQDAYDKTIKFLNKQGCKAMNRNGDCLYLDPRGNKCGVGAWIPKEHPAVWESGTAKTVFEKYPDLVEEGGPLHIEGCEYHQIVSFWEAIQELHDASVRITRLTAYKELKEMGVETRTKLRIPLDR